MTLNQRIITALTGLGMAILPDVDTEHRERCFTFHYDLLPAQFADDRPTWYRALIQIHLLLPLGENSVGLRRQAIQALVKAGFAWPEVINASDQSGQHFVLETEQLTNLEE